MDTKVPNYKTLAKLGVAKNLVTLLNEKGWQITYAELAKILQLHPLETGRLLGLINLHHKEAGGTKMITGCIVDQYGHVGAGYAECAKELELEQ